MLSIGQVLGIATVVCVALTLSPSEPRAGVDSLDFSRYQPLFQGPDAEQVLIGASFAMTGLIIAFTAIEMPAKREVELWSWRRQFEDARGRIAFFQSPSQRPWIVECNRPWFGGGGSMRGVTGCGQFGDKVVGVVRRLDDSVMVVDTRTDSVSIQYRCVAKVKDLHTEAARARARRLRAGVVGLGVAAMSFYFASTAEGFDAETQRTFGSVTGLVTLMLSMYYFGVPSGSEREAMNWKPTVHPKITFRDASIDGAFWERRPSFRGTEAYRELGIIFAWRF